MAHKYPALIYGVIIVLPIKEKPTIRRNVFLVYKFGMFGGFCI